MFAQPAIVVAAHARPAATRRLLASLVAADVPDGTRLIVSIDHGSNDRSDASAAVAAVADTFEWPHGPTTRIDHEAIGLVEHFHRCGDLSAEQPVIVLEDDLIVGPGFYRWVEAVLPAIGADTQLLGASLTAPWFDGFRQFRFEPVDDGADVVYAQVPWYDGMVWTDASWCTYRAAAVTAPQLPPSDLPAAFGSLGDDEWFPDLVAHLVATDRYWALPRSAHATGTGAAGSHFERSTDWFQSELAAAARADHAIGLVAESGSVYDAHMEPTAAVVRRLLPDLPDDLVIDLLGVRDLSRYDPQRPVVTTRPSAAPQRSWGAAMHPLVMNLVYDEPGEAIHLSEIRHVDIGDTGDKSAHETLVDHHRHGRHPGRRELFNELVTRTWRGR